MGVLRLFRIATTLGLLSFTACTKTPTEPPSPAGLSGTWSGDASDSSGAGSMTWQIAQDASPFGGLLFIVDSSGGYAGKGSVTGTVSGATLHVTMSIAAGGFDAPFDTCTATMTGDATWSASSITGSYTGTSSCGGNITAGQFTLTKP